jgi:hypothetical protein
MEQEGRFLGLPYDFRKPTWRRIQERVWNPRDPHIFTPKVFGWGFTINLYEVVRRVRSVGRRR